MRFLLDVMLGTLATYLRMCGHDTAYALDRGVEDDDAVLALARAEGRRLLTRDAGLAARAAGSIRIEATEIEGQLRELREAGVELSLDRPERCSRCNDRLERVEDGGTPDYAPDPEGEDIWRCTACGQHYWKGSHWEDVRDRLESA
ncbi:MAG: Mut7-C RNAse domain-containing protein [Halobacteriales archaeon]